RRSATWRSADAAVVDDGACSARAGRGGTRGGGAAAARTYRPPGAWELLAPGRGAPCQQQTGGMRAPAALLLAACLAAAGCAGGAPRALPRPSADLSPSPLRAPAGLTSRDRPAYHPGAARTGAAPARPAAGPPALARAPRPDGAVWGQPLVVGGLVIAATEGDTVYGLSRARGRILWRAHLGTPVPLSSQPCGGINPLGITGTMVYDPATGLVYAAATTGFRHVLAGIDITDGQVRFRRDIP